MTTWLVLIGFGAFALLAWFRREWGVYLIILLLPSYQIRFVVGPLPMTFLEGMILLLAVRELVFQITQRRLSETWRRFIAGRWRTNVFVLLFLLAAGVSVFVSPVLLKAIGIFKAFFAEAVLFYFLFILIIDTPKKLQRVWQMLTVLILSLSVFGIYQFLTLAHLPPSWWAVNVASRRITSLVNHPNALALLLGPLLGALVALPKKTKITWLAVILGAMTLYLSLSRAAWLALLLTLLVLGVLTEHRKTILIGILALVVLIFAVPFSRQKVIDLVRGQDLAQQNRIVLWSAAADMLKKSPLLGVGLMGFHETYKNYPLGPDRVVQNYPHNFFLNFWLETGLSGLVAMLGLLVLFYKKIRELLRIPEWRGLALASGAGMLMILLHGLVDVPYFKNDLAVLFWLIYALPNLSFLQEAV